MDSIVNKLTEIEDAASAIVRHAEEQKEVLNREYEEKRRVFDQELETSTQKRLDDIQRGLDIRISSLLSDQSDSGAETLWALRKDYEEKHTEYAHEILKKITEV